MTFNLTKGEGGVLFPPNVRASNQLHHSHTLLMYHLIVLHTILNTAMCVCVCVCVCVCKDEKMKYMAIANGVHSWTVFGLQVNLGSR